MVTVSLVRTQTNFSDDTEVWLNPIYCLWTPKDASLKLEQPKEMRQRFKSVRQRREEGGTKIQKDSEDSKFSKIKKGWLVKEGESRPESAGNLWAGCQPSCSAYPRSN